MDISRQQMVVYEKAKLQDFQAMVLEKLGHTAVLKPELGAEVKGLMEQNPELDADSALLLLSRNNPGLQSHYKRLAEDLQKDVEALRQQTEELKQMGIEDKATNDNLKRALKDQKAYIKTMK
jgi:hypothetical protein